MGGKGGIFGSSGFGFNSGTISGLGGIEGLAGGLLGGTTGSVLMGAASGIGAASSLASILGISSIGGPVGLAIGAAIGGGIALFSALFGKNKQRKADEKTRNQAMGDAFAAIDALLAQVNNDPDIMDAASVISQGQQIRDSYVSNMSQLKDKKTCGIALRDVSRIDEKLRALETLAKAKAAKNKGRAEALNLDVPTFADGGALSDFARKNFQDRPLGYVTGPGSARSDSILARFLTGNIFWTRRR